MADPWSVVAQTPAAADSGGWEAVSRAPSDEGGFFSHPMESVGHGLHDFAEHWNPVTAAQGINNAVQHPLDTIAGMGKQNSALWDKVKTAYDKGDYVGAVRHGINYALNGIPGVGASADQAGDKFERGDFAGGVGDSLGLGSSLVAPAYVPAAAKAVGRGLRSAAEPLAESALGIRAMDRAYGKTPGAGVLDETTGLRPATVAESARQRLEDLNSELESAAAKASGPASLNPARKVLDARTTKASAGNSTYTPAEIAEMRAQLTDPEPGFAGATEFPAGANTPVAIGQRSPYSPIQTIRTGAAPEPVISADQSPLEVVRMKREFGKDFTKWNPLHPKGEIGTARQAYRALDNEIDRTVPGAESLNQRISSVIPVAEGAEKKALNAGVIQNVAHRVAAHTGAMALSAGAGYAAGGIKGAIAAPILQELVSTPAARMAAARMLNRASRIAASNGVGRAAQVGAAAGTVLRDNDPLGLKQYVEGNIDR